MSLGAAHPETVAARAKRALVLANFLGRRQEAKASLEAELENADAQMGPCSALSLELCESLAACYLEWAREDPRRYLRDAVERAQDVYARYGECGDGKRERERRRRRAALFLKQ